jgi:hypothetical protein
MPWYCEHSDLGATVYLIGGVAAIGGLGTAAFGLVDASKAAWGGVNHIGFSQIQETVKSLTPGTPNNALSQDKIALAEECVRRNPYGDDHVYVLTAVSWREFSQIQRMKRE